MRTHEIEYYITVGGILQSHSLVSRPPGTVSRPPQLVLAGGSTLVPTDDVQYC